MLDSDNPNRKLPYFDYGGLVKPALVNTRSADSDKCQCTICNISRLNGNEFQKHEKAQRNNPGRPAEKVHEISSSITQCSNCHSEIGRGRPHDCTRTARQDNLVDLVRNHSGKTQEQVASKLLDAIYEDKGVSKQGIEYGLCADIKIYLCIIGKQTASCLLPVHTVKVKLLGTRKTNILPLAH